MNTASTATLSQREANAAAFAQTSAMLAMDAMLSHRPGHLKMPRPDAYFYAAVLDSPEHLRYLANDPLPHYL